MVNVGSRLIWGEYGGYTHVLAVMVEDVDSVTMLVASLGTSVEVTGMVSVLVEVVVG